MKRKALFTISTVLIFLMLVFTESSAFTNVTATSIHFSAAKITLYPKQTYRLQVFTNPVNATNTFFKWYTSNPKVATVDKGGVIRAFTSGEAEITAKTTNGKLSTKCKVSVAKKMVLMMWTAQATSVKGRVLNNSEVGAFKELEKRTGITVNYTVPVAGAAADQFNLMMASNDLPDMIGYNWIYQNAGTKYGNLGQIVALNDYINSYAPNLKKVFAKDSKIKAQLQDYDGKIWCFPQILADPKVRVSIGYALRNDWLNKLDLSVPTTVDEFYNVLKAFKERDPNGNKKADEIPLVNQKNVANNRWIYTLFYFWGLDYLYQDNGKVKAGYIQPEYKSALTWINKLYVEGLLDPDFAITDVTQYNNKFTTGRAGATFAWAGGTVGALMTLMKPIDPKFELAGIPWLKAPNGIGYSLDPTYISLIPGPSIAITTQSKHIPEAIKWADYAYSAEGGLLFNFGVEGKSYDMVDNYPKYKDQILNNPLGLSIAESIGQYAGPFQWPTVQDPRYYEQYQTEYPRKAISVWKGGNTSRTIERSIKFSNEDNIIVIAKLNDIKTYTDEMMYKFIMGKEPLSNFDKYVAQVKSMGIDEVVSIYQKALDARK